MAKSSVPAKVDADRNVAALIARHHELKAEERRLESEFSDIEKGIANARSKDALDDAARELLADGVASLVCVTELYSQRDAVQTKLRVVRRAIQMNQRELDNARSAAGRRISEACRPEYVGIVRRMAEAVAALQSAIAVEAEFRDRMLQNDVSLGNGVIQPMAIGFDFTGWLAEAQEYYGV